jgi:hypothetical protein
MRLRAPIAAQHLSNPGACACMLVENHRCMLLQHTVLVFVETAINGCHKHDVQRWAGVAIK